MKTTLGFALAVTVGLVLAVAPMLAHHSFAAEFDGAKPADLVGTVTKVDWVNPHSWIYIDVKSDDGTVANWGLETGPPNVLYRGWLAAGHGEAGRRDLGAWICRQGRLAYVGRSPDHNAGRAKALRGLAG